MAWWRWDRQERLAMAADRWLARLHKDSSPRTMRAFEQWRDRHPDRVKAVTDAEGNWRALGQISPLAAAEARRADGAVLPSAARSRNTALITLLAAAAAFILIMAATALYWHPDVSVPRQQDFAADTTRRLVHLADGSTVILDRDSAIVTAFAGPIRAITLQRGHARFTVAHDPARPFIVTAGDHQVVARGTIFDVTTGPGKLTVAMLQGVVDVKQIGAKAATRPIRLGKGQQLVLQAKTSHVTAMPPGPQDWAQGLLTLDTLPLGQILEAANRNARKPILLADPSLDPMHVQGQLPTSDTRLLAQQLAAALDLELREEPDGYVLTQRH